MPAFRSVDAAVLARKPTPKATSPADTELAMMVAKLSRIKDEALVYEGSLQEGEKASTVRSRLLRAAKIAGVEVAVRRSPMGWYVGLMTPERRSRAGRKAKAG